MRFCCCLVSEEYFLCSKKNVSDDLQRPAFFPGSTNIDNNCSIRLGIDRSIIVSRKIKFNYAIFERHECTTAHAWTAKMCPFTTIFFPEIRLFLKNHFFFLKNYLQQTKTLFCSDTKYIAVLLS